ncbi:DoxX family protein [Actinophytocola sp.]|uniref:DoxX family protein n=1 Tax=Actinophytocola sp. TaxID=1872138 RepID=UPI002D239624|nr:DoxX family protein [Actinophytocola sp.]HYQ63159.1 DoxX family protein [Actinophytocola sp.]
MNLALWIAAGLLTGVALLGGLTKTLLPRERIAAAPGGGWTADVSEGFVRSLGVLEILAAVGLVVPALVGIAPVMVPVTAVCWVLLMIGAMITHARHDDGVRFLLGNLTYLVIAAFIALGRFGLAPF